ncbi:MAG TPA: GNAT family N-acetyltransferase [Roseiflexaceae bacterium]|nr:GNAT family N-acetyltransferase [Roseiflexaceae bacterium]
MGDVLTDLSEPAMFKAVKANMYTFFRALERAPSANFHAGPALVRWLIPIPHPWFRGALVYAAAPGDEHRSIRETRDYFRAQGVPVFTVWISPEVDPSPWERALYDEGFTLDGDPPGMAADLHALVEEPPPAGLVIRRVEDDEMLRVWNRVLIAGFGMPEAWEQPFYELGSAFSRDGSWRNYLGYLDGAPVATSSLFPAAGVAGIINVATLPAARRRGVGAAMTLAPLREARAEGCRVGVLQSSNMGLPVYTRIGFRNLGPIEHFVWAHTPKV